MKKELVMLAILDGFGLSNEVKGNAVYAAKTPNLDYLLETYPNVTLDTSGEAVGLPEGQMGNSEVGHLNIGAGRVVYQSLTRVNLAIKENKLEKIDAIDTAFNNAINNDSRLHLMGLVSDGGVHSHIDHFLYLIEKAVACGIKEVIIHAFLDGRDVPPKSAKKFLEQLQNKVDEVGHAKIGVVSGRYYAMDRDRNYNRTQLAYDAIVYNKAKKRGLIEGLEESYDAGITDEFVVPYIVNSDSNVQEKDSIIFMNFRPDRAIQLSTALTNLNKTKIENGKTFEDITFVSMMLYSQDVKGLIAFDIQTLDNTYGEVISNAGLKQLRIAETEKYAHVTYFFDGGIERDLPGAERILIPSPKVATYDLQPEMSAYEVCDEVIKAIKNEEFDTIILNFANCDMVGHTAVFDATVKAVEVVDVCIGRIYKAIKKVNGKLLVTADHGNAEKLLDENEKLFSAHTTNPVPFVLTEKGYKLRKGGNLGDITPTMLELLNVKQPSEMTGKSLIKKD